MAVTNEDQSFNILTSAAVMLNGFNSVGENPGVQELSYRLDELLESGAGGSVTLYLSAEGNLNVDQGEPVLTIELTRGTSDFIRLIDQDDKHSGYEVVTPMTIYRKVHDLVTQWVVNRLKPI